MTDEDLWEWVQDNTDYDDFDGAMTQEDVIAIIASKGDPTSPHYKGFIGALNSGGVSISDHLNQIAESQKMLEEFDTPEELSRTMDVIEDMESAKTFGGSKLRDQAREKVPGLIEERDIYTPEIGKAQTAQKIDNILKKISEELGTVPGTLEEQAESRKAEIRGATEARLEDVREATTRLKAATTAEEVDTILEDILSREEFQEPLIPKARASKETIEKRARIRKESL